MRCRYLSLMGLFAAALFATLNLHAEDAQPDPTSGGRYEFREDHDPNGIGKFYLGREIAHVMGHQGIQWLERAEREEEEGLTQLVDALDLKPGQVVADIGAGSGIISLMMAKKVGPKGTVLAVDIQQEMLDALAVHCKQNNVTNIEPILGTTTSPNLKPGTVDLVIMVDVYHEFDMPFEMLSAISKSLKPGGRIAFVEYRKEDPAVPIKEVHKMSEKQVRKEAAEESLGLVWLKTFRKLPRQHVVFFEKKGG
ncbi:MAG: methyltransferase domain-containing protein [Planctomycetota bacterium]|nr:MAG: methyltransferase domain-containing protein [Planctomycetota bacterium]